jgi:Bacterial Ig-like domain (group 2)
MFAHCCVRGLLLLSLGTSLVGCSNQGLDSVRVTPATQSLAVGQTAQLTATGTYGNANHASTQNLTSSVTWTSGTPSVATVSTSGVVTAVSAGSTIITASATGFAGPVNSTADVTVTGSSGGTAGGSGGSILSLTIIPSGIAVGSLQESGQFLAIGTFSTTPTVRDLTNSVTWFTSAPNVFPVTTDNSSAPGGGTQNGGVVTAYGSSVGNVGAVITAEATDSNMSIATATATFGCPLVLPNPPSTPGSCYPGSQGTGLLSTLTVYNEGLNTTAWYVTAPSATNTPNVLHCGPGYSGTGGSVCTETFPVGAVVLLTAQGGAFGGWSYNCTPSDQNGVALTGPPFWTAAGPNYCTVTLTSNDTVGAIFN